MASKLAKFVMSKQFDDLFARGVKKAAEEARAAGLPPAGDERVFKAKARRATVVYEAPRPTTPKRKTPRVA
ncbi:hypothetical protein [Cupriavidus taiwanensis]|uniref:Uncharacterized protein n=1 Tax=Cupriavidus taiwanensis TaxID=164546 RepID=A0A7Z7NQ19_9BURK|nr:hypothetical protein [Cupriavidus taiwanensis]SOZ17208.1 conserved hypothetical protein [Cupriavidus taiwanensis]SOZ96465.1 conserved hypothetical protein [Cupriavidus taiwanensis]SPC25591.1 conserved hypothetical protein [Cupriavidus taiwanensis]